VRILGLDIGEKRIGVAFSDPGQVLATPWGIIERGSKEGDFARIRDLVEEFGAEKVVVGYPLSLDGNAGPQARRVERYAAAMAEALAVPVILWDERYSTKTAADYLRHGRQAKGRRKKSPPDAAAAAVILQDYLESAA
jgi:putative Holliday junction resolvase